jgi:NAD(P)-dependent dehydrogenase (short-subunit alcohol dehydrogenase family)
MAARLLAGNTVMVLGGAGLVGTAIARRLAVLKPAWRPGRIVVASLCKEESLETVSRLKKEQSSLKGDVPDFVPEWGNIFARSEFAHTPLPTLLQNHREELLADLYDDIQPVYEQNHLVDILRKHQPNVLIDSVNTATGLSYQNVFDTALKVRQALQRHQQSSDSSVTEEVVERMLLSQSVPALVRHIQILSKAAQEISLENYIKIGTTGTGGMGKQKYVGEAPCQSSFKCWYS